MKDVPGTKKSLLLFKLSRRTSGGRFIPEVDGFRFLAIFWVLLYHVYVFVAVKNGGGFRAISGGLFERVSSEGHFGVEIFFVLSGFVLAQPFASHSLLGTKPVRLGAYFLRRITRLEPPYIVSLIMLAAIALLLRGWTIAQTIPQFLTSLFYVHNPVFGQDPFLNPVGWSLEVEIQFYILVPVLALVFHISNAKLRRGMLLGAMATSMALQALWVPPPLPIGQAPLALSIVNFIQYFLGGFLVADLFLVTWSSSPNKNITWDFVGLVAAGGILITVPSLFFLRTIDPFLVVVLLCAAFRGRYFSKFLSNAWIYTIGGMCYSIYLVHFPIIWGLGQLTLHLSHTRNLAVNLAIQMLVLIPASIACSAVFFLLIEGPCMDKRWPQKVAAWFRRRKPTADARIS